jgi:hypothetical protein
MKTLTIFFLFGTFLFSSCKKDRTCGCYYTTSGYFPYGWQSPQSYKTTVKATKGNAKEKCNALDSKQGTPGVDYVGRDCNYEK